jgi:enoyl reductase
MAVAIAFSAYGGPEVLHQIDVPDPLPGTGQVRVRVRAAGVNPVDCKLRRGDFDGVVPVTFPQRLGNEFAGVVDAVGEPAEGSAGDSAGGSSFKVGDEVLGFTAANAYTHVLVVGTDQVARKPRAMPWEVAGSLSAVGQTALNAVGALRIGPGECFLVHAAAGGVGTVAVQLAVSKGATVIGTASERNHAYLWSLGAIPVSYGPGLVERVRGLAPDGVDAALDAIGGEAVAASVELGIDPDRIGTIVDETAAKRFGVHRLRGVRSAANLEMLAGLYDEGALALPITATFPLSEVADAHRIVETGHVRGKVALTVE